MAEEDEVRERQTVYELVSRRMLLGTGGKECSKENEKTKTG